MAAHDLPLRRRVVLINRVENRAPGRVAFVVHRTRAGSRRRAAMSYRLLAEWLRRRETMLAHENPEHHDEKAPGTGDSIDSPEPADPETSDSRTDASETPDSTEENHVNSSAPRAQRRPSDEWTKGRLYELARNYDLTGRSKLNKADLLEAVVAEWDRRNVNT